MAGFMRGEGGVGTVGGASAAQLAQLASLKAVATSGEYNDLTGKPTLGTAAALAAGSANGVATLDAGGLIPTAQLPPLAINKVDTVASQSAMLALTSQRGDMAVRSDTGKTYVLSTDSPSTLADWKEVLAAGQVQSVNGQTGVVSLAKSDVGLGSVPNTDCTNATNLASGTLANARLSADVMLRTLADAKGDILAASGADVFARLAVGTNGQILTADSAQTLGVKWATPSGGGGGTLLEGVAILAPTGNDTTGAIGTSSAAPLPYATAQAAVDDGAKVLLLMPKATSYGDVMVNADLNLTVISYHDETNDLPNQLGAISTGGHALQMTCLTGPRSCSLGTVATSGASVNAGALTLTGFRTRAEVIATGDSTDGTNGGTLTMRNFIADSHISASGGQSATPGGNGGIGGTILLEDGIATGELYVNVGGGSGSTGSGGDSETPGGTGGNGAAAGIATVKRIYGQFRVFATGGGFGSGGSDGGAGVGTDGGSGMAGTINVEDSRIKEASATTPTNSGGNINLDNSVVTDALAADGGTIIGKRSDYPAPTGLASHVPLMSIVSGVGTVS